MMTDGSAHGGDTAGEVRAAKRAARAALSAEVQAEHARLVATTAMSIPELTRARTIAGYLAMPGELDVVPTLELLSAVRHLPRMGDEFTMRFLQWVDDHPLVRNSFGIAEPPATAPAIEPGELDVVLVPLVAFDHRGHRIGMGAGYYDRAFAFRRHGRQPPPFLLGVAHALQEVPQVPNEAWDVPLDAVVTENGFRRFAPHRATGGLSG